MGRGGAKLVSFDLFLVGSVCVSVPLQYWYLVAIEGVWLCSITVRVLEFVSVGCACFIDRVSCLEFWAFMHILAWVPLVTSVSPCMEFNAATLRHCVFCGLVRCVFVFVPVMPLSDLRKLLLFLYMRCRSCLTTARLQCDSVPYLAWNAYYNQAICN